MHDISHSEPKDLVGMVCDDVLGLSLATVRQWLIWDAWVMSVFGRSTDGVAQLTLHVSCLCIIKFCRNKIL